MAKLLIWCRGCQSHEDTLEVADNTTMGYAAMYMAERWNFNTEYPWAFLSRDSRTVIPRADRAAQWDGEYVCLGRPQGGRQHQGPGGE